MILCATCHPPVPDWIAEWRQVEELKQGISDPTVTELVKACDAALKAGDYPAFLREKERLVCYVGGKPLTQGKGGSG
jgi:hypothetical protein